MWTVPSVLQREILQGRESLLLQWRLYVLLRTKIKYLLYHVQYWGWLPIRLLSLQIPFLPALNCWWSLSVTWGRYHGPNGPHMCFCSLLLDKNLRHCPLTSTLGSHPIHRSISPCKQHRLWHSYILESVPRRYISNILPQVATKCEMCFKALVN